MAYIPEEDEDSQEPGMNVLAGAEQAPQEPKVAQEIQGAQGVQGAGVATGTPAQGTQEAQQSSSGTRKQKGSGMFTDIRKYIKAGQPSAQRISGAVTGKAQKQAKDIRGQVQKQQQKFQQNLQQQQQKLQQSQQFTQQAVEQAGSGQLAETDFQRFRDIASGKTQFDVAQPVDLLKQKTRAQALQRLAQGANRAGGREELLRQTFARPDRPYTRGQRSLDALLLGSSPEATKQVVEGTRQQFGELSGDITQARKQAIQDVYGLKKDIAGFTGAEGEAAKSVLGEEGARTQLGQQLDVSAQQEFEKVSKRRDQLLGKLQKRQFLTPTEYKELGVADKLQGTLQGFLTATGGAPKQVDFAQYLDVLDPKQFNRQAIADPEQKARFEALSQLVGREGLGTAPEQDPGLRFNAQDAIQDVLSRMGREDISVGEQGLTGRAESLKAFQTAMLGLNPFMAAGLFGTQGIQDKLAETTGVDLGGAQAAIGEQLLQAPETLESALLSPEGILTGGMGPGLVAAEEMSGKIGEALTPDIQGQVGGDLKPLAELAEMQLNINPFRLIGGDIQSAGKVLKSAEQIVKSITPGVTGDANIDRVLAGLASGGLTEATKVASNIASEAKRAAEKAKSAIRNIFCFATGSLVKMSDGGMKKIEKIELGDETWLGGEVTTVAKSYAYNMIYEYKGAFVTGSHAVFEEGEWGRVEESPYAIPTEITDTTIVHPIITENHVMVVNDFISADFQEVDGEWDLDEADKIEFLNADIDKNRWLLEEEKKLQGGQ